MEIPIDKKTKSLLFIIFMFILVMLGILMMYSVNKKEQKLQGKKILVKMEKVI